MDNLKPTRANAINEHCAQCMGYWYDGREDCENTKCPLYKYMPYAKLKPDLSWTKYNPKRVGRVLLKDCKTDRKMTEEQKKLMKEGKKKNG